MKRLKSIAAYVFLVIAALISIYPFFWMVVSMTNRSVDVTGGRQLPGTYLMENLNNLFGQVDMVTALGNSTLVAVISTLLTMLLTSLAGYGFHVYRSRRKDIVFNVLLLSMMIPFAAIMIPLYRLFGRISQVAPWIGIDTLAAAFLPTLTTAFFIFFFRQNTGMFPEELIEASRLDGLSETGIFFRIYIPTMKTTYAAAAIIAFMNSWNNFLWPLIVLQSPAKKTVPLLISNLGSSYAPDYGMIMSAITIATLPTVFVFFLMQKHFVAGMTGSVKG
ncbi:carbohydrate ABC transporter permease [Anaerotalea alkaliphila]|uniref:Carbohydrate ABC transporter permease n=1 Tax=Anaerotalea alkaliphila TaxID=2662126 RepID=A0A7X5KMJ7_9FIRM|nr:carbohydrate ABC transporter permease [Anaerotalea alkaliphila]NDL67034.1 carbohydrate ABC transporter permease [Anaerotalea alkaliphila]